jgi:hypothetical protein
VKKRNTEKITCAATLPCVFFIFSTLYMCVMIFGQIQHVSIHTCPSSRFRIGSIKYWLWKHSLYNRKQLININLYYSEHRKCWFTAEASNGTWGSFFLGGPTEATIDKIWSFIKLWMKQLKLFSTTLNEATKLFFCTKASHDKLWSFIKLWTKQLNATWNVSINRIKVRISMASYKSCVSYLPCFRRMK